MFFGVLSLLIWMNRIRRGQGTLLVERTGDCGADEKGMAYIYARNTEDAMMAYGSPLLRPALPDGIDPPLRHRENQRNDRGERKAIDTRMRTIGFHRHASGMRHPESRNQKPHAEVHRRVNAYIQNLANEHPLNSGWRESTGPGCQPLAGHPLPHELDTQQTSNGDHRPNAGGKGRSGEASEIFLST